MQKKEIVIRGRFIGNNHPPLIIAEMSGNHNQSLERALRLVDAAADAGADALKIQTYTADTMTLDISDREFVIDDPESPWVGMSLYELYQKAHMPWDWHEPIFDRAKKHGMIAFSTPFDESSVDFLEELDVPCYKIASFENTDLPLIRKVAETGKPMIIATGMATLAEMADTVCVARDAGCTQLVLLKCTSSYPASPEHTNITTIPHMRTLFDCEVGLSDHTLGTGVSVASIALGATVIEKHFTLSRSDGGVDAGFSLEPEELVCLVNETKRAWMALGDVVYGPIGSEKKSLDFRRSLYIVEDLHQGEVLTKRNLRAIRPGKGLPTKYLDICLGKSVRKSVAKGTALQWDLLV